MRGTRAFSVRPSPRHRGTQSQQQAKRVAFASAARTAALWLLLGPSRPRRGRVGNSPKGRAHDARAFAVRPGTACQRASGASSRSRRARCPATAAVRVPSLWLLSLGQARESNPLARTASGKTHGREPVLAKKSNNKRAQKSQKKKTGISRPFSNTPKKPKIRTQPTKAPQTQPDSPSSNHASDK